MDVKEAAATAFGYVQDLFSGEDISDLGLEEVERDSETNAWLITVGFSRPWDYVRAGALTVLQTQRPVRSYKVLTIDAEGNVVSLKDRKVD